MPCARCAPVPPGDVPAHRASPQFKPRAGVHARGRTRGHDGRSHRGARSFVRFLRGGARPARSRARALGVSFVSRLFFPHTAHRPCTAADQGRQRRQGGGGGPRRGAPRRGGGVRRARRHQGTGGGGEAQRTEEEGGGCQPADGARPVACPFHPIPPRVGRGHVAGAGAHPVSVPTTPRATFATSPAPFARTPASARDDARDRSRARAVDDARAPRARPPPQISHPQIAELFKARQVARPRLDSWILKSTRG